MGTNQHHSPNAKIPILIIRNPFSGLSATRLHKYVAGGKLTHNCPRYSSRE
jgi:hypothetical protein